LALNELAGIVILYKVSAVSVLMLYVIVLSVTVPELTAIVSCVVSTVPSLSLSYSTVILPPTLVGVLLPKSNVTSAPFKQFFTLVVNVKVPAVYTEPV